jgi:hypothetical protein
MRSISLPIAGIVAAALLDHRWSWGTLASVLLTFYCHWLYRRAPTPTLTGCALERLRLGGGGRPQRGDPHGRSSGSSCLPSDRAADRGSNRSNPGDSTGG